MADWHWETHPDDLLQGLPENAVQEAERLAQEITVRESMVFLDGQAFSGTVPGLRTEERGGLMLTFLTDVRGERIVIVQVTWLG